MVTRGSSGAVVECSVMSFRMGTWVCIGPDGNVGMVTSAELGGTTPRPTIKKDTAHLINS